MHVPVQDMQVCCVQQMGTHMLVRAGATYTHRHEDEQDTDAPSLAFFFSTSLPALGAPHRQLKSLVVWPILSGEVLEACFIFFWGSIT